MLVRWLEIGAVLLSLWLAAFLWSAWSAAQVEGQVREAMIRAEAAFMGQAALWLFVAWLALGALVWFIARGRRA